MDKTSCHTNRARGGRLALLVLAGLLLLLPSSALAAGGTSIASAPTVVYGQQQFGNTATDQHLEDSCGFGTGAYRSYWLLNVLAGDLLTIDWESGAHATELKLMPVGTTDFTLFQTNQVVSQGLSSNGRNEMQYTAPQTGLMPLYFRVCQYYEGIPGPYDFIATDQHALVVSLKPYLHIKSTTTLSGTASLADGSPLPDGLVFTLTVTWPGHGLAQYQAATAGGTLSFPLALPASTQGKPVTFTVTRPADTQYQAAKSTGLKVKAAQARPKPRKCRKGFKKRTVHGKVKCVKAKPHHRASSSSAVPVSTSGLERECIQTGLARPSTFSKLAMHYAGLRPLTPRHWHSQGAAGWFQVTPLPENCTSSVVRAVTGQIQMQKRTERSVWINIGDSNGNINHKNDEFFRLEAAPNHAWPDYVFNECAGGRGWLKVRGVIDVKIKDSSTRKVLAESRYPYPAKVHGSCQLARISKRETANYQEEWGGGSGEEPNPPSGSQGSPPANSGPSSFLCPRICKPAAGQN